MMLEMGLPTLAEALTFIKEVTPFFLYCIYQKLTESESCLPWPQESDQTSGQ